VFYRRLLVRSSALGFTTLIEQRMARVVAGARKSLGRDLER
jgi:hypothetical protein